MTNQNPNPGSGYSQGNWSSTDEPGSNGLYPDLGTADPNVSGDALGSDDTSRDAATSEQVDELSLGGDAEADDVGSTYGSAAGASRTDTLGQGSNGGTAGEGTGYGSSDNPGAADQAREVAGSAADHASELKDAAVAKATDLKDVAVERGADVAAVAKDEVARLAGEARAQVQDLWSQASGQLREQADTGRQQLADLLHSLSGELGEMASKSTQSGPLTSLAKQAAARGGELSHWLSTSDSTSVMTELRRFARRRPLVFLGGAALAGVLVGRLSRGLMAVAETDSNTPAVGQAPSTGTSAGDTYTGYGSVPATSGVTSTPPVSFEEVPNFGTGESPSQPYGYSDEGSSHQPLPGDNAGGLR